MPSKLSSKAVFLAADVGAGAPVQEHVAIPAAAAGVHTDQPRLVCLVDGGLQVEVFVIIFAANVDVGRMCAHRETGDQAALDQLVRIVPDDIAILAGARLALISVDHQVGGTTVRNLGHE